MVVDTSALVAILNREPERESFLLAIEEAERGYVSALSLYETQLVVLSRLGEQGLIELEERAAFRNFLERNRKYYSRECRAEKGVHPALVCRSADGVAEGASCQPARSGGG
ncbi:MAG: type II toxin-antitoxin system VapC family toxin [Rhodomicrobium sp.]